MGSVSRSVSLKCVVGLVACAVLLSAGAVTGQQKTSAASATKAPQITTIFPAGAQRGTTVQFEIKGKNLNSVIGLYFSRQFGTVQQLEAPSADRLMVTMAIDDDTELGSVELRAVSIDGISNLKL